MGIARTSSVYLTMAVTLERYYAIVKPFASREWLSSRKPVVACFLFGTIYNIPKLVVKYRVTEQVLSRQKWSNLVSFVVKQCYQTS